jgi:hypothetical protein
MKKDFFTQRRKALPRFSGFLCVFASFAPLREMSSETFGT